MTLDELIAAIKLALEAEQMSLSEAVELRGDNPDGPYAGPYKIFLSLKGSKLDEAIVRLAKRLLKD